MPLELERLRIDTTNEMYYALVLDSAEKIDAWLGKEALVKKRECECGNVLEKSQQLCATCKASEKTPLRLCKDCGTPVKSRKQYCELHRIERRLNSIGRVHEREYKVRHKI